MTNGLQLLHLFDFVFLVAMSAWLGSILFFSFGVAPILFRVLPPEHAGRLVRALFPIYYAWGTTAGAVALPATFCGPLAVPEMRGPWVAVRAGVILLGVLIMFYGGNVLTPAINAARDAGPPEAARFGRLHRRSVWLNGLVLVLGLSALGLHVWRPGPSSRGIVDPTPQEIVRKRIEAAGREAGARNSGSESTSKKRVTTRDPATPPDGP
jgi:putative copper export protein